MTLQTIIGMLLRHALTAFGGSVFTQGLLAGDTVNQIAGTVAGVIGLGLSAIEKKNK